MPKIQIVVNNTLPHPFVAEHGLAIYVEYNKTKLLFDTGAGSALRENLKLLDIDISAIDKVVLSHGHNDHTGGLEYLSDTVTVYAVDGIDKRRYSIHSGIPIRDISMPATAVKRLNSAHLIRTNNFMEIADGIFLTGSIPRISGEDCGGPFFLDKNGKFLDRIDDEQALLTSSGVLIHGCCHSGIINTLEYCKKCAPNIKINTVIGGLHLVNASDKRIEQSVEYLKKYGVEKVFPLHCSGDKFKFE